MVATDSAVGRGVVQAGSSPRPRALAAIGVVSFEGHQLFPFKVVPSIWRLPPAPAGDGVLSGRDRCRDGRQGVQKPLK